MGEYITKPICKVFMLKGQEGQSIKGIKKTSTSGLADTYTITLTDGTTSTFSVTNGKGIESISKTGTSGLADTYTIRFNDGTTSTFTVTNGAKGDKGDGIPSGGIAGQVLKKKSNTDYEYEWDDITTISSILNGDIDSIMKD